MARLPPFDFVPHAEALAEPLCSVSLRSRDGLGASLSTPDLLPVLEAWAADERRALWRKAQHAPVFQRSAGAGAHFAAKLEADPHDLATLDVAVRAGHAPPEAVAAADAQLKRNGQRPPLYLTAALGALADRDPDVHAEHMAAGGVQGLAADLEAVALLR